MPRILRAGLEIPVRPFPHLYKISKPLSNASIPFEQHQGSFLRVVRIQRHQKHVKYGIPRVLHHLLNLNLYIVV